MKKIILLLACAYGSIESADTSKQQELSGLETLAKVVDLVGVKYGSARIPTTQSSLNKQSSTTPLLAPQRVQAVMAQQQQCRSVRYQPYLRPVVPTSVVQYPPAVMAQQAQGYVLHNTAIDGLENALNEAEKINRAEEMKVIDAQLDFLYQRLCGKK